MAEDSFDDIGTSDQDIARALASSGGSLQFTTTLGGPHKVDIPLTVFRALICAFGIFGNLLVILVILILAEYKKAVTHWYVLQLAIADSIFLMTIPFRISEHINDGWIFPEWMCKAKETILFLNYYSSIGFLMIMSVDRYIAVCHGFSGFLQKFRTQFAAYVITAAVWIISLLICVPIMMYSTPRGTMPNCKCEYAFPKPSGPEYQCQISEGHEPGTAEFDECVKAMRQLSFHQEERPACAKAVIYSGLPTFGSGMLPNISGFPNALLEETGEDFVEFTTGSPGEGPVLLNVGCHYHGYALGFKAFLYFNFVVMFIVPLIVMTLCYTLIVIRLKSSRVRSDSGGGVVSTSSTAGQPTNTGGRKKRSKSAASVKDNRNRNRVTLMCACLVILFIVCWLPFHAVHLAKVVGIQGETEYCMNLFYVASLLAYLNSAINPYLYNFIGTRFARRLRSAASTVRHSVKQRTSSLSGSVRYQYRKRQSDADGDRGSSHGATVTTKIFKGRSELAAGDMSSNNVFTEDSKHEENQPLNDPKQPNNVEMQEFDQNAPQNEKQDEDEVLT